MYHNGLRYGRIAALVLFTHIVMLLAVLFRGNYETIQDLAPLTIAVLGLDVVYIIVLRFFYKQMTYTTDFLLLLILNISVIFQSCFGGIGFAAKHYITCIMALICCQIMFLLTRNHIRLMAIKKYLYIVLGVAESSLSLVSAVAGKYAIDIITGYQISRLWVLLVLMVASAVSSLLLRSAVSRISARVSLRVNNDIRAEVFDCILRADWRALNRFSSGDLLNRLSGDAGTVAGNAISWLPDLVISLYTFIATFAVILYYDWVMAVLALASAPFLLLTSRRLLGRLRGYNEDVRRSSSELMGYDGDAAQSRLHQGLRRDGALQRGPAQEAGGLSRGESRLQPLRHQDAGAALDPRVDGADGRVSLLPVPAVVGQNSLRHDDALSHAGHEADILVQRPRQDRADVSERVRLREPNPRADGACAGAGAAAERRAAGGSGGRRERGDGGDEPCL